MLQRCFIFLLTLICATTQGFALSSKDTNTMKSTPNPTVLVKTNMGDIIIELDADKAPTTVKNFLEYVKEGHYDHTIFHRVIDNFMIQGGGFTEDMQQKPVHAAIQNEADNGLLNKRGTIAMARTSDVNSATAQFFINVADNSFLDFRSKNPRDYGYCVFGHVTSGMNVVDMIRKVKTSTKGPHENVPVSPVEILEIKQQS